ncbi:MAG: protein of unknown function hydrolase family protein [Ramlibacter sp.]|nr:protein of unknown function hydrolase family protein [Ramlibacter sp.]
MARDARVETAISHWAPRLISNGVLWIDFQEVTRSLDRWEDWCAAWCKRGEVHELLGREALESGYRLSAGEHLSRAAVYYHFAKFMFVNDVPQMKAAHMRAIKCRQDALPYLRPPGVRVEIPYERSFLAGILRVPTGVTHPPVMIMVPGLESAKEEMEAYELPFLARGIATLMVDTPGQGEAEYEYALRGDSEVAVTAVVDWLQGRADIDRSRIGLWGVSLGGYLAPRAAAFEKRIKACISLSGPYDVRETWDNAPEMQKECFRVRSHLATLDEAASHASTLTLKGGIARQIECPLFIVMGKQDRLVDWRHSQRLADEASGPVKLLAIEDGNHISNNRPYRWRNLTADWMAAQLGLPQQ